MGRVQKDGLEHLWPQGRPVAPLTDLDAGAFLGVSSPGPVSVNHRLNFSVVTGEIQEVTTLRVGEGATVRYVSNGYTSIAVSDGGTTLNVREDGLLTVRQDFIPGPPEAGGFISMNFNVDVFVASGNYWNAVADGLVEDLNRGIMRNRSAVPDKILPTIVDRKILPSVKKSLPIGSNHFGDRGYHGIDVQYFTSSPKNLDFQPISVAHKSAPIFDAIGHSRPGKKISVSEKENQWGDGAANFIASKTRIEQSIIGSDAQKKFHSSVLEGLGGWDSPEGSYIVPNGGGFRVVDANNQPLDYEANATDYSVVSAYREEPQRDGRGYGGAGSEKSKEDWDDLFEVAFGEDYGGRVTKPILLDLDGTGIRLTELSESTRYVDSGNSGLQHRTAWAGAGDGVLFFDPDGRDAITETRQYVFTEWDPGAASDLEALRSAFDSNGDGKLTSADGEFAKFKVLVTKADGGSEVKTLAELNITEIDLTGDATRIELADGSMITGQTSFTRGDGTTGTVADATLASEVQGYRVDEVTSTDGDGNTVTQNPREVATKFGKRIDTFFAKDFAEAEAPVRNWTTYLDEVALYSPDDSPFPATALTAQSNKGFTACGFTRAHWKSTVPVRRSSTLPLRRLACPPLDCTPFGTCWPDTRRRTAKPWPSLSQTRKTLATHTR